MITLFILTWFATTITFLLGYFLGKGSLSKQTYQDIKKEVEHRVLPQFKQPSGVIQRPSAERIYDLQHPKVLEEKEEMEKTLKEDIQPLTP